MSTTRVRRVEMLFQAASELDAPGRARFLADECGSDAELREEVEELLRCGEAAPGAFLRGEGWGVEAYLEPGTQVGGYEVLSAIGEGGMGTVYEAQQASPRRVVALKVIRPGRMTEGVIRRFRHEADVLGSLQHPGIAQVHEAGQAELSTETGEVRSLPFFAMELVRGKGLNAHAERLDLRAKLELVARICDAVQHAHQRGIIHRDLKPENILVVEDPREAGELRRVGQPKILDFGIARAIGSEGRRATVETRVGHLVGTLEYMSPEQVGGDRHAVDTRSDVYALGILLYELIAGSPPLDVRDTPLLEAARRIREDAPVPLRTHDSSLPVELEWICNRALEKRNHDRYPGAGELAADLRRFLRGEPIDARRHSTFYVLKKTLRRHRALALTALLFLGLLTAFSVVSSIQAARNRRLAASAQAELTVANIERGRLLGRSGMLLGEELLWREYLRDPDSPHAYWALWEFFDRHPRLAALPAHGARIHAVAFAPDGSWVATGGVDGLVKLWNPRDQRELAVLQGAPDGVFSLEVTPDGGSLLAGCEDGTIVRWNLWSPEPVAFLRGHVGRVTAIDVHPDGEKVASSGYDGSVRLWDLETGRPERVLIDRDELAWSVRFSPDGQRVAAGFSTSIYVWYELYDAVTLEGHAGEYTCVVFSSDGRTLYSGNRDRRILTWDLESRSLVGEHRPGNGTLRRLWIGDEGNELHALGLRRIDTSRLPTFEPIRSIPLKFHTFGADVSPSDGLVAIGTHDGVLQLWGEPGQGQRRFPGHVGRTFARLSPDGRLLATGDAEGVVRLWDVSGGALLETFRDHSDRVRSLRFSPDGRRLATAGRDGTLRLRDLESRSPSLVLHGIGPATDQSIDFSPDGTLIAATCAEEAFRVWRVEDGSELLDLPAGGEALVVRFTPDGGGLATVARESPMEVRVWNLAGEPEAAFEAPTGTAWDLDFSPDGTVFCTGTWSQDVRVWDVADERLVHRLEGHNGTVFSVEINQANPDLVVSGSEDGTVWLWSLSRRRNVATLTPFGGADVRAVSLSRDGRTLAVSGEHPDVLVWDLTYPERHMAGNLRLQLERLGPELGDAVPVERLLRWEQEVLARPWPRWGGR